MIRIGLQAFPVAEPLQVIPPWLPAWLLSVALVGFFTLWMWRRSFRRLADAPTRPQARDSIAGFQGVVERIRERHLKRKSYRHGCHELSAAVKTRLEELTRLEMEEMTAGEIVAIVRDVEIRILMADLRAHQFSRRPPKHGDFLELCRLAELALANAVQVPIAEPVQGSAGAGGEG